MDRQRNRKLERQIGEEMEGRGLERKRNRDMERWKDK